MWFVLSKTGFGEMWIKRCVTYARVLLLVNGSPSSEFVIEKGHQQRCPLSSLLFNLVVEALLILVNQFKEHQWLIDTRINGLMERTTIFQYANDTIMFLGCFRDYVIRLQRCLYIFSMISGLRINLHKSFVTRVGMNPE